MSVYILDTETTGLTAKDQIIELSYINLSHIEFSALGIHTNKVIEVEGMVDYLNIARGASEVYTEAFKPTVPIHPMAYQCHGKTIRDLIGCRPSKEAKIPEDMYYMIGHNITFDHKMLGKPAVKLIDSLKIVKKLRKTHEYFLNACFTETSNALDSLITAMYPEDCKHIILDKHSALDDCIKVVLLLAKLYELYTQNEKGEQIALWDTWEQLYNFSEGK